MRNYRLAFILKRDLSKKESDKLVDDVKKWAGDVKKDKMTELGERKFSYKIKGEESGTYFVWEFESEKIKADLERRLTLAEDVLRHLLVRTD